MGDPDANYKYADPDAPYFYKCESGGYQSGGYQSEPLTLQEKIKRGFLIGSIILGTVMILIWLAYEYPPIKQAAITILSIIGALTGSLLVIAFLLFLIYLIGSLFIKIFGKVFDAYYFIKKLLKNIYEKISDLYEES